MDPDELFEEHYDDLRRYLVRFTGEVTVAEDACQEAFVRLAENSPDDLDDPRGWLFTVATNAARDTLRTRSRRGRLMEEKPDSVPTPHVPAGPDEAWERRETRRRVRRALDQLSHRNRTVLLMREEGFRHQEIAEAVGTTTGAVGTMIARALEKLADELGLKPGESDG